MAHVGYIRVSSTDQNTERQLDGITLDKVFEDKASGVSSKREALQRCLDYLREGDTLHVHSIDRLARNLLDLQKLVNTLTQKGVTIQFHAEKLTFSCAGASPVQTLLFQLLGAFAQFERACIRERQREGIEHGKAIGKHMGRPSKLSEADRQSIVLKLSEGSSPSQLASEYGVSISSIHKLRTRARERRQLGGIGGQGNGAENLY